MLNLMLDSHTFTLIAGLTSWGIALFLIVFGGIRTFVCYADMHEWEFRGVVMLISSTLFIAIGTICMRDVEKFMSEQTVSINETTEIDNG